MEFAALARLLIYAVLAAGEVPPVPGGCSEPAAENQNNPGCFLSAELGIDSAPAQIFWHIYEVEDQLAAASEAKRHRWSVVVLAHERTWLYVLGDKAVNSSIGIPRVTIGPLDLPEGQTISIRFLQSIFPPGMRTRVHSHAGVEAFFVVEGEQCMETPTDRKRVPTGQTYIVPIGPHVQAAPRGRRNLALVVAPAGQPWMTLEHRWQPSDFCFSGEP